jgi:hypothetical protein
LITAAWRAGFALVVALAAGGALVAQPRVATAAPADDARALTEKGTAAFALGRFAEAADHFEKAFEIKPDAALLYNAAQSHRLASNKERALVLYQSYLRVYGNKEKRSEVDLRIRELKEAIAKDRAVATSPPTTTQPVPVTPSPPVAVAPAPAPPPAAAAAPPPAPAPPPPAPAPPPPPVVAVAPPPAAAPPPPPAASPPPTAAVSLVAQPAPPEERSVTSRPWFWVAVGGAVVAAAAVTLLLVVKKDPDASIGVVP